MGITNIGLRSNLKTAVPLILLTLALPSFANSQVDSAAGNRKLEITIDGGRLASPRGFMLTGWAQRYSIRAGVGTQITRSLWGHASVEYRRYNSGLRWGGRTAQLFERDYPRSDVAFYLSLTALRWFQVGAGGIAQFHEDMWYHWYHWWGPGAGGDSTRHVLPANRRFKLLVIAGIKYDIPLGKGFYIPVGLFVDLFHLYRWMLPLNPTGRVGVSKRF